MAFQGYATLELTDYERERLQTTFATFEKGVTEARAAGTEVVIVFVPMKFRIYGSGCDTGPESLCAGWTPWALDEEFAAACDASGLTCLDLTGPMREAASRGELLYAPEDSHWNEAGHAFVAELLHDEWPHRRLDAP